MVLVLIQKNDASLRPSRVVSDRLTGASCKCMHMCQRRAFSYLRFYSRCHGFLLCNPSAVIPSSFSPPCFTSANNKKPGAKCVYPAESRELWGEGDYSKTDLNASFPLTWFSLIYLTLFLHESYKKYFLNRKMYTTNIAHGPEQQGNQQFGIFKINSCLQNRFENGDSSRLT